MTTGTDIEQAPLFFEAGASWYWVLSGPLAAGAMLLIEHSSGHGWEPLVPTLFLVLVSGFVALQVKAARIHTSVELTPQTLRQGTETIKVAEILQVYPEAGDPLVSENELQRWQSARALGELTGVPRGRVGVGLRMTRGRTAQAWARRHRSLRAALTALVEERVGPAGPAHGNDDDSGEDGRAGDRR